MNVSCAHCDTTEGVVKNGKAPSCVQRFLFVWKLYAKLPLDFVYNANKPGTRSLSENRLPYCGCDKLV
ncbi:hypothetical protein [Candidatus Sororendozoicomonas aggregata]|uniref:hypothetical protein n=1 Tax=Candidatus Sororendozoicomonas aggregata TaxID=3073239 RepID=UPI003B75BAAE